MRASGAGAARQRCHRHLRGVQLARTAPVQVSRLAVRGAALVGAVTAPQGARRRPPLCRLPLAHAAAPSPVPPKLGVTSYSQVEAAAVGQALKLVMVVVRSGVGAAVLCAQRGNVVRAASLGVGHHAVGVLCVWGGGGWVGCMQGGEGVVACMVGGCQNVGAWRPPPAPTAPHTPAPA